MDGADVSCFFFHALAIEFAYQLPSVKPYAMLSHVSGCCQATGVEVANRLPPVTPWLISLVNWAALSIERHPKPRHARLYDDT